MALQVIYKEAKDIDTKTMALQYLDALRPEVPKAATVVVTFWAALGSWVAVFPGTLEAIPNPEVLLPAWVAHAWFALSALDVAAIFDEGRRHEYEGDVHRHDEDGVFRLARKIGPGDAESGWGAKAISGLCYKCHPYIKSEFSLPTHHPLPEGRISCLDCHDPHGSPTVKLLREATVKETCTVCHGEKEGPFAFEHADVTEDCRNCHVAHGSINNNLLTAKMPFLCYQCHKNQPRHALKTEEDKLTFATRCADCHTEIHGTDTPGIFGGTPGAMTR